MKPEVQRLRNTAVTKMSPFSVYGFLVLPIPVFISHGSLSVSLHRHMGQRLISHLWKKPVVYNLMTFLLQLALPTYTNTLHCCSGMVRQHAKKSLSPENSA